MKLKTPKKDIVVRATPGGGAGETSNLRPRPTPKTPPCVCGCPQGTDIRGWVQALAQHEAYGKTVDQVLEEAFYAIAENNPFPATCGRVCPHPCEDQCNRIEVDEPVHINAMERHIGDFALEKGLPLRREGDARYDEKVAVIGAGPAGLTCAYHLARKGYRVTVFEAFPKAGGMLYYGIPPYRLPRDVLQKEVDRILALGVELRLGTVVGRDVSYDDLKKEYRAIFVGIGAHKGKLLRIPGEDAPNVWTGTEFLNKCNSGEKVEVGNKVLVIGGGDTAIDAARVSRRLGAEVTILYRRTRVEMPAIKPEIEGAEAEGVKIELLVAPKEVIKGPDGRAVALRCLRCELGEPDDSGRRRPVPVEGSDFDVPCTAIIAAVSQEPDFEPLPHLREGKDWVKVDAHGQTKESGVFAGGDVLDLGLATIAIAQGKRAAVAIDCFLRGQPMPEEPAKPPVIKGDRMKLSWYKKAPRNRPSEMPVEERLANPEAEIATGLSRDETIAEAKRCLSCGMCFDCETCWMFCQNSVFERLPKGQHYKFKIELCNGCKKCAEECPCGYIEMV